MYNFKNDLNKLHIYKLNYSDKITTANRMIQEKQIIPPLPTFLMQFLSLCLKINISKIKIYISKLEPILSK